MKTLFTVLVLAGLGAASDKAKPYEGVNVTIRSTRVASGTLRIEAQSTLFRPVDAREYRHFVFSCDVSEPRCVSPEVGEIYVLRAPDTGKQVCDKYEIGRDKQIPVCLVSVR